MTDDDLDRIWAEYAGPVFRPKWVLPCLRAIASAARAEGAAEERGTVREPVRLFARDMESKLRLRDAERGKRGWGNDALAPLFSRLVDECKELAAAIQRPESAGDDRLGGILEECADVGNFAMMIADIARSAIRSRSAAGEQGQGGGE